MPRNRDSVDVTTIQTKPSLSQCSVGDNLVDLVLAKYRAYSLS